MDFGAAINWILSGVYLFCGCAFVYQRIRWERRNRREKKNAGFCPSYSSLGCAFQVLHKEFVLPEMAYMYEEQMKGDRAWSRSALQRGLS